MICVLGCETQGGALDLHHGDQTHVDLQFKGGLVAKGQAQSQQDRTQ